MQLSLLLMLLDCLAVADGSGATSSVPAVLTAEEEAVLRRHYEGKLQPVCKAFSFPHKIQVRWPHNVN
jgi:hypothetical protein